MIAVKRSKIRTVHKPVRVLRSPTMTRPKPSPYLDVPRELRKTPATTRRKLDPHAPRATQKYETGMRRLVSASNNHPATRRAGNSQQRLINRIESLSLRFEVTSRHHEEQVTRSKATAVGSRA
jgi:hypothetical protein